MYDCIVVGAGIEGCSSAYQLAKNGYSTLLLEQFPLPHNRGSSHGQTRITRYSYGQKHFSDMMLEAYPMWKQLEEEANTTLYSKTGVFQLEEPPYEDYNNHLKCLKSINKPYRLYSGKEINQEFPGVRFEDHYKGMLELDGGVLMANKCLQSYQNQFVKFGGTLQDGEKVLQILPGRRHTIVTNKGRYLAKSVVLTPGPWASQLLKPLEIHLPLQPQRVNVCYWKEKIPGTYASYPCLLDLSTRKYGAGMYALPSTDYPGLMKVCYLHTGKDVDSPDHRDYVRIGKQRDIDTMRQYIREHFPGLHGEQPAILETCMFTSTPDGDPVIDRHPLYPNLIFAVGMSGHGFKLAPVFGKILFEMATGRPLSYDITPVSMKRYSRSTTVSKL
ncbi:peroxisomal sarcosine oxidase-like [Amphiura filiformis]|uniref:peroxisomal sarcosine oxidase-like n=1 Tax=Amphiura filiformis TaxID=82378 RepID=UPI003B2259BD